LQPGLRRKIGDISVAHPPSSRTAGPSDAPMMLSIRPLIQPPPMGEAGDEGSWPHPRGTTAGTDRREEVDITPERIMTVAGCCVCRTAFFASSPADIRNSAPLACQIEAAQIAAILVGIIDREDADRLIGGPSTPTWESRPGLSVERRSMPPEFSALGTPMSSRGQHTVEPGASVANEIVGGIPSTAWRP